jgi:hypothetical protein
MWETGQVRGIPELRERGQVSRFLKLWEKGQVERFPKMWETGQVFLRCCSPEILLKEGGMCLFFIKKVKQ